MSNNQLAGFPAFGPRVDSEIIYNPAQTILETPEALPTSEPATAQVQITTAVGQLPVFSPHRVPWNSTAFNSAYYRSVLVAIGRNESGTIRTIYAKYKSANTPTWSGTSSVISSNTNYCCFSFPGLSSWSIGDVQEVKLYANGAGCNLYAYGLVIIPDVVGSGLPAAGIINLVVDTASASLFTGWTTGTPAGLYASLQSANGATTISSGAVKTVRRALAPHSSSGILTTVMSAQSYQNTAPAYYGPVYPTRIAYTPIL